MLVVIAAALAFAPSVYYGARWADSVGMPELGMLPTVILVLIVIAILGYLEK